MKPKQIEIPAQISPSLDPNPPESDNIFAYYILDEPQSPSVAPPNALDKIQYMRSGEFVQQYLHDAPNDWRRPWGFVTYERELTFAEIDEYHLLPFKPFERDLYDMWLLFDKDKSRLLAFLAHFFRVVENDPGQKRLSMALRLIASGLSPRQIKAKAKSIPSRHFVP